MSGMAGIEHKTACEACSWHARAWLPRAMGEEDEA